MIICTSKESRERLRAEKRDEALMDRRKKMIVKAQSRKVFLWLPRRLYNGDIVWLRKVWRRGLLTGCGKISFYYGIRYDDLPGREEPLPSP